MVTFFWQEVCEKEITLTSAILFVTLHFHPTCLSASPRFWLCQTAPWPTRRRWGNTACQSGYLSDVSTNTGHTTFTRKGSATRWNCQQEKSHHWQTQKVSLTLNVFYLRDLYWSGVEKMHNVTHIIAMIMCSLFYKKTVNLGVCLSTVFWCVWVCKPPQNTWKLACDMLIKNCAIIFSECSASTISRNGPCKLKYFGR